MKRIAIIGVTGFGKTHLNYLTKLAGEGLLEPAAAVVRTPAKAEEQLKTLEKYRTRIYASAEELFAAEKGRIDLVCVPTAIGSHEDLTCRAQAAEMNVLLEKPAAGSVAAVERMIAAQRADRFVAVAFQHCYAPEILFFKKLLVSGRLGKIVRCGALGVWPRRDNYYERNAWAAHRTAADGAPVLDSPVNNALAHYLNLLLFLNGGTEPETARALSVRGELYRARPQIEMFDACDVAFSLAGGVSARVLFAHCAERAIEPRIRLECEKGVIEWLNNSAWQVAGPSGETIASGTAENPEEAMFRQVLTRLSDPAVPVYTLRNALEHTRCVEMLDSACRIRDVEAEKKDGVYCVPGLSDRFEQAFGKLG